jgi:hypothetical protein
MIRRAVTSAARRAFPGHLQTTKHAKRATDDELPAVVSYEAAIHRLGRARTAKKQISAGFWRYAPR